MRKEDWYEAAATMADIYVNSHVTIAATFAQNSNDGLFSNRASATYAKRLKSHPHLHVLESPEPFPEGPLTGTLDQWPLLSRAWVYQERKLSPRTIYFGKYQVYWKCKYHFASEDGCEDYEDIMST
ncbi:tol [Pyrenophora seminiperda CCB06]|uniref:Tol n=1 Tax=Pyrenophora seminiperda CCB06 TaxID=1302712 RepID=A0A3M7M5Z2_9PLEO|nr:tol [Pyrenophora seminiperda CCB06]